MTFIPGDPWKICDLCGMKVRQSETRLNWKHQVVCKDSCWEPKHPQLSPAHPTESKRVYNPRPRQPDVFVTTRQITADDL